MIVLDDPWVVGDTLFLRAADGGGAVRLPSPPVLLSPGDGPPVFELTLFRYPVWQPMPPDTPAGGGLVVLAVDLGAPVPALDRREAALPAELLPEVAGPVLGPGQLRLWLGDQEIARAAIPGGFRPIVPLTATMGPEGAMLLREGMQQGSVVLAATAEGGILARHDGPPASIEINLRRATEALGGPVATPAAEVAAALDRLVEDGLVRFETAAAGPVPAATGLLCSALAAGRLFQPVPGSAESWTLVPGATDPAYQPAGELRPRADLGEGTLTLTVEGEGAATVLPWFAAGPIEPPATAVRMLEVPASPVVGIRLELAVPVPEGVSSLDVEVEVSGGERRAARFTSREGSGGASRTLRFLPPPAWDRTCNWRVRAAFQDGASALGEWRTARQQVLVVDRAAVDDALAHGTGRSGSTR
jgi:hypothetical protein